MGAKLGLCQKAGRGFRAPDGLSRSRFAVRLTLCRMRQSDSQPLFARYREKLVMDGIRMTCADSYRARASAPVVRLVQWASLVSAIPHILLHRLARQWRLWRVL